MRKFTTASAFVSILALVLIAATGCPSIELPTATPTPTVTYTVAYNGNGNTSGYAPTDAKTYARGTAVTVLGNTNALVKTSYTFIGWNTKSDGTGTSYASGVAFTMGSANVTLYARWTQNPTYTVTYDGNGNTGGTAPTDSNNYLQGATVTIPGSASLTRTNYVFTVWNTLSDGKGTSYAAGATFPMGSSNVILYAIWVIPTYSVTYNGNGSTGGSVPTDSAAYAQGATITVLGTGSLTNNGYNLAGWMTKVDGTGTSYAVGATFVEGSTDLTLYAVWVPDTLSFTSSGASITITGFTTAPTGTLSIPIGVTSIGNSAFNGCTGLSSVIIPSSVTSISDLTFSGCTNLASITIPPSVTSIGGAAFSQTGFTSITIPSSVTSIGDQAFYGCAHLVTITLSSKLTSISAGMFQYDTKLTSVTIPTSVTSIGQVAFMNCSSLTSINIPSGVASIGQAPFMNCSNLASISVDAANAYFKSDSAGVIYSKDGTTLVMAPPAITTYAIPSNVTSIGVGAFVYCASLTSVTIPSSVTSIGQGAFQGCAKLASVTINATTPPTLASGSGAFNNEASGFQIKVPAGTDPVSGLTYVALYQGTTGWSDYSTIIVSQ